MLNVTGKQAARVCGIDTAHSNAGVNGAAAHTQSYCVWNIPLTKGQYATLC
jgi:hypothetical protein